METPETPENNISRSRGIYLLPNLFTLAALFAGFYAIIAATKEQFEVAAIAIFVAMVMDALDGRVARLTQTQTAFGAELDSLSDMVSFGVAPALVLYYWSLNLLGKFGWLSIFIYAVAVALRLARFNVQLNTADKHYFKGLPCPAAAAVVAGLVWNGTEYGIDGHHISILIAIIAVILGLLMVSNLRYNSFKDIDLKGKVPFIVILILVAIFVLVSIEPATVLLVSFSIYAISGPLIWLWKWRKVRAFKKR